MLTDLLYNCLQLDSSNFQACRWSFKWAAMKAPKYTAILPKSWLGYLRQGITEDQGKGRDMTGGNWV